MGRGSRHGQRRGAGRESGEERSGRSGEEMRERRRGSRWIRWRQHTRQGGKTKMTGHSPVASPFTPNLPRSSSCLDSSSPPAQGHSEALSFFSLLLALILNTLMLHINTLELAIRCSTGRRLSNSALRSLSSLSSTRSDAHSGHSSQRQRPGGSAPDLLGLNPAHPSFPVCYQALRSISQ